MKTTTKTLIAGLSLISALAGNVMAQTTWTGNVNSNITEAGNWNPANLPTSAGNPGTINSGTVNLDADLLGYFVTQEGGTVAGPAATARLFRDGSWTVDGGTFTIDGAFSLQTTTTGNQSFTITDGTVTSVLQTTVGNNSVRTAQLEVDGGDFITRNIIVNNGSTLDISGGTFTANNSANASGIRVNAGSSMNISGGIVSSNQELRAATNNILFSGGTTSFSRLNANAGFGMTLGGNIAGTVTFTNGYGGTDHLAANISINWLTGSLMGLTIGAAGWAETEWAAGRMTYNGQNFNTLGNWATVTAANGLGGGANFELSGNTLTVIPEPSTFVLMGLAGLAALFLRRRRG